MLAMAAPPRILLALAAYATAAHFEFTNPKISQCAIDGKRSGVPWLTKNDAHYICTDANWDALYDPASTRTCPHSDHSSPITASAHTPIDEDLTRL